MISCSLYCFSFIIYVILLSLFSLCSLSTSPLCCASLITFVTKFLFFWSSCIRWKKFGWSSFFLFFYKNAWCFSLMNWSVDFNNKMFMYFENSCISSSLNLVFLLFMCCCVDPNKNFLGLNSFFFLLGLVPKLLLGVPLTLFYGDITGIGLGKPFWYLLWNYLK